MSLWCEPNQEISHTGQKLTKNLVAFIALIGKMIQLVASSIWYFQRLLWCACFKLALAFWECNGFIDSCCEVKNTTVPLAVYDLGGRWRPLVFADLNGRWVIIVAATVLASEPTALCERLTCLMIITWSLTLAASGINRADMWVTLRKIIILCLPWCLPFSTSNGSWRPRIAS